MNDKNLIWNPLRKGYMENPHEQLRLLREQNPVHKGINGSWVLFRYDDVKLFLTSPNFKTWKTPEVVLSKNRHLEESENFNELSSMLAKILLFLDPPEHAQLRSLIVKIWTSYSTQDYIQEAVEDALKGFSDKREIDIVADFAAFIPTFVICKILGLPFEDYAKLRNWSYKLISTFEPFVSLHDLRRYNQNAIEFREYMTGVLQLKKRKPDDLFISRLLIANEELDKSLTPAELVSILCLLFFAGMETSVNLLGQSVFFLLKNPDQAELARRDKVLSTQASNELIRYVAPTQYTKRIAVDDIEIQDKVIKTGDPVLGSILSANFDDDVFEDAEQLDLTRVKNSHLSFGHGLHYCIGARLARDEASAAIPAFLRLYPNVALRKDKHYEWDTLIMNRALKSLPVTLNQ